MRPLKQRLRRKLERIRAVPFCRRWAAGGGRDREGYNCLLRREETRSIRLRYRKRASQTMTFRVDFIRQKRILKFDVGRTMARCRGPRKGRKQPRCVLWPFDVLSFCACNPVTTKADVSLICGALLVIEGSSLCCMFEQVCLGHHIALRPSVSVPQMCAASCCCMSALPFVPEEVSLYPDPLPVYHRIRAKDQEIYTLQGYTTDPSSELRLNAVQMHESMKASDKYLHYQ
jgi:hypothetical protein